MNSSPDALAAMLNFSSRLGIMKTCRSIWTLRGVFFCLAALLLFMTPALHAQLPVARLYTISPPGGKIGTGVDVTVTGSDLDELRLLHFSTSNITAIARTNAAGAPEPNRFVVSISSNTPPGIYEVRAAGRYGISNPRSFAVDQFPEVVASPTNTTLESALEIAQETIVNGRVEPGAFAWFHFPAKAGERLLIACADKQIDSRLAGTLILYDADQHEIARNRRGGLIDYRAVADARLLLRLSDFEYRGGVEYFYRLCVTTRPHLDFVYPTAAKPGTTNRFTLYGRNLPGGTLATNLLADGNPLEQLAVDISMPDSQSLKEGHRSLAPDLAAVPVQAMEYRLLSSNGVSNPVLISAATAEVVTEQSPNETPTSAQKLQPPCEVSGQFFPADDRDWYSFEAKKGDVYWFEIFCHRLGIPSDPFVLIQRVTKNEKGEEQVTDVKELYDSDPNFGGQDYKTSSLDPAWRMTVSETGTYRVAVRDLFNRSRSDPRLTYRFSIRKETPGFELVAIPTPNTPPKKDSKDVSLWAPVLRRGQTLPYKILVFRRDNFDGEITLSAEGLPSSITCVPTIVPAGSNSTMLMFTAATNAQDWAGAIQIVGKGKSLAQEITSYAHGAGLVWNVADNTIEPMHARLNQEIVLSVCATEPAPVTVVAGDGKWLESSANGKLKIPVKVARAGDFTAVLKLKPAGLAALDSVKELDIDNKTTTANLEIDLAKQKIAPGNYTFHLQSQVQGKYQSDAEAAKKAAAEAKEAEKALPDLAAALKKADEALKNASKALSNAEAAAKKAEEKLTSAKSAAEKNDAPASTQAAKTAAEQESAKTAAKLKAAQESKAAAEKAFKAAEAKSKAAEAKSVAAAARAKELAEKSKPKDATILVYSTPVQLKVLAKKEK